MKKKLLLICIGACATANIFAQSLFTYGNIEVSKDEFMRAFSKNMSADVNKEQSLKDYLQLYTTFKQKVAAAKV
jgi:peptidyl-prolyl cis-trans isomerase SurA